MKKNSGTIVPTKICLPTAGHQYKSKLYILINFIRKPRHLIKIFDAIMKLFSSTWDQYLGGMSGTLKSNGME